MTQVITYTRMRERSRAQKLARQTHGSAGYDLANGTAERIPIHPGKHVVVRTGIRIDIPSGYEAQIRSRSGLAAKNGCRQSQPATIEQTSNIPPTRVATIWARSDHANFTSAGAVDWRTSFASAEKPTGWMVSAAVSMGVGRISVGRMCVVRPIRTTSITSL